MLCYCGIVNDDGRFSDSARLVYILFVWLGGLCFMCAIKVLLLSPRKRVLSLSIENGIAKKARQHAIKAIKAISPNERGGLRMISPLLSLFALGVLCVYCITYMICAKK